VISMASFTCGIARELDIMAAFNCAFLMGV